MSTNTTKELLKIENLHVKIQDNEILKGLDLNINEGEIHVVMGTNGAGKSTLVKAISAHYECEITDGSIQYKDKNLVDLEANEIANEGVFLSFQNPVEVSGVNNSYFLKTAFNAKKQYHGEEEYNSIDFFRHLKDATEAYDIDQKLFKRDLNDGFSGGEKKRNELIQLLLLQPNLIMLDEIDSGLDVDAIKTVSKVINDMMAEDKTRSLLIITHYDRLLELITPDFVHIIKDGKIAKTGGYELALQLDKVGFEGLGIQDAAH
jgi:Fe-S cluster assembly ATP-binding protein